MVFACLASCFPLGTYVAHISPRVGTVGLTHPSPHSEMYAHQSHADPRVIFPLDLETGLSWSLITNWMVESSPGQCDPLRSRVTSQGHAGVQFFFFFFLALHGNSITETK